MSDLTKTVRSTYSKRHLAINNAQPYANQEQETVFVWKGDIGAGQHEYTLRKRADIIDVHSDRIVHTAAFTGRPPLRIKTQRGLRVLVRVDS